MMQEKDMHNSDQTDIINANSEALSLKSAGSAFYKYFANIYEAFRTLWAGLAITVPTFFKRPVTVQYPDVDLLQPWDENNPNELSHQVSERYRGFLFNDIEKCTSCRACSRICPVECIVMKGQKYPEVKGLVLEQYEINYALCIYCGLCVEACPVDCLTFQRDFEHPVSDLSELKKSFVSAADHQRLLEKAPRKVKKPKPATDIKNTTSTTAEKEAGKLKMEDKTKSNSIDALKDIISTTTKKKGGGSSSSAPEISGKDTPQSTTENKQKPIDTTEDKS